MKYNPNAIEKKWQKYWAERKTFKSEIDRGKPKYYILDMFPYPSGSGLHVGHVTGYTGTDILARYKRQRGFNVLHPMGWDSFGLPAEQHAIRTGEHPSIKTKQDIGTYRRQLESLGFSYDWDREVATSDPSYYKWTQWIFTKLYEKGLAYEAEINVNFCPALGTVLANEEVENGRSVEGGYPVEQKPLRQWILRITAYADRLLADLDLLDWPDHLKKLQTNWIGRSEGTTIAFECQSPHEPIVVFTTRPDTIFGVTFLVLAPNHPLVEKITTLDRKDEVAEMAASTEKVGVWTGAFAINPVNRQKIPIWIANYVVMDYGTGAVMGVPSDDERDLEFAEKYHLPILPVIEEGKMVNSGFLNGMAVAEAKQAAIDWVEKQAKGQRTVQYKLRDWLFSRQRYWGEPVPILHFADGSKRALGLDELPLLPPTLEDFKPAGTGESPLAKVKEWVEITDTKTGKKAKRETNTMPQWAGSCWYYLRFCDPRNNQEAWSSAAEKYWMPVDLYVGGVEHAVLHLLYSRFWHKVLYDCGLVHTPEPFVTLRNQGLVTANSYKLPQGGYVRPQDITEKDGSCYANGQKLTVQLDKMSKSKLNGVSPDEVIEEVGADTLRLYEMFMGPFDQAKVWSSEAVSGCYRFLNRFHDMVFSDKVTEEDHPEASKLTERLVDAVTKDIEGLQFNTAIAKMMEFLNKFIPLPAYPRHCLKRAVQMLYPFAPHIGEELWQHLTGSNDSITYVPIAPVDPAYLIDDTCTYVLQINGKLRGKPMLLEKGLSQDALLKQPEVQTILAGKAIKKVIFVPNKLLNVVVE
jgi:leucyl-tRNA synthetase